MLRRYFGYYYYVLFQRQGVILAWTSIRPVA